MIRKYHNYKLQTCPQHREVEPQNIYSDKTSKRKQKQSNQLFLPPQDDCKTRTQSNTHQNKDQHRTPTNNGRYIEQKIKTNKTTTLEQTVA